MKRRILGIDPGSQKTGYAIIDFESSFSRITLVSFGVIKTNLKGDFYQRIYEIGEGLKHVIDTYEPSEVSVEKIFLGKNVDSAFKLGHARGVVLYECNLSSLQIFEYATRVVKKSIAGSGAADKQMILNSLETLLKVKIKADSHDASDALALAVHHAYYGRTQSFYSRLVEA